MTTKTLSTVHVKTLDVTFWHCSAFSVMNVAFVSPIMRMRRQEESSLNQRLCRTDLARFLGKDWCKKPTSFPPEFTIIAHNHPLLERFLR